MNNKFSETGCIQPFKKPHQELIHRIIRSCSSPILFGTQILSQVPYYPNGTSCELSSHIVSCWSVTKPCVLGKLPRYTTPADCQRYTWACQQEAPQTLISTLGKNKRIKRKFKSIISQLGVGRGKTKCSWNIALALEIFSTRACRALEPYKLLGLEIWWLVYR